MGPVCQAPQTGPWACGPCSDTGLGTRTGSRDVRDRLASGVHAPRHRLTPAEADVLRLQPVKGNHGSSCLPGPEAWWRGVATASWGPEEPAPPLPCNSGNLLLIWEKDRGRRGWPPPPPTHPANDRRSTSASHKQTTPMRAARLPRRCEGPSQTGCPGPGGTHSRRARRVLRLLCCLCLSVTSLSRGRRIVKRWLWLGAGIRHSTAGRPRGRSGGRTGRHRGSLSTCAWPRVREAEGDRGRHAAPPRTGPCGAVAAVTSADAGWTSPPHTPSAGDSRLRGSGLGGSLEGAPPRLRGGPQHTAKRGVGPPSSLLTGCGRAPRPGHRPHTPLATSHAPIAHTAEMHLACHLRS